MTHIPSTMLAARLTMSTLCIVFSSLVAPLDGTRKLNGTNCAMALTGASSGVGGAVAFELSPE
jgi:hypothetical protein